MTMNWIVEWIESAEEGDTKFKKIALDIDIRDNVMTLTHMGGAKTVVDMYKITELHYYIQVIGKQL